MEEAQEILLNSLQNSGISLPEGVTSIRGLSPGALVSICLQSLQRIDGSLSFATSLPDSVAERFKICSEISSAIQILGFRGELSFHQFLYPSEEDSYKLMRFLVERLSVKLEDEKAEGGKEALPMMRAKEDKYKVLLNDSTESVDTLGVGTGLKELKLERETAVKDSHVIELQQKFVSLREQSSKIRNVIEDLKSQEELLKQQLAVGTLEVQQLESKHELLQAAVDMAVDDQHPVDFHVEELNRQVETKKRNIVELESQWNASIIPLKEKKRLLEELVNAQKPKVQAVELEIEAIFSEIQKREEEHSKLLVELQKQPKVASRKSYIQRITEITKNSRKQDLDIERIQKETRELQISSNSIQERLHRTYSVVDETIFREAKNDPVRRQAYRLLTSIHESFEQISDKILATDRTRRDIAELESKLAAMGTRNLNIDELQADLDAIRNENHLLEQQLHHH